MKDLVQEIMLTAIEIFLNFCKNTFKFNDEIAPEKSAKLAFKLKVIGMWNNKKRVIQP